MTDKQSEPVSYSIKATVTVEGVEIHPGNYKGERVRFGMKYMGQTQWNGWEYKIDPPGYGNLDCTAEVSSGQIKASK